MIAQLLGQRIDYRKGSEAQIRMIRKMLDGTFDPEKDIPKKGRLPGPEEMQMLW